MTPSENRSEREVAALAQKIFRRGVLQRAEDIVAHAGGLGLDDARDPGRAEIDDLHGAGASIMMLSGRRSWCSISLRWKARRPLAICSTMSRTVSSAGLRVVDHPLRQRLPVDVFGDDIEKIALARRQAGFQHMRAVDAPRHPFLHQEALQIGGIVAQVDRRNLQRDDGVGLDVDGEIDVAAAGAVQLPHDAVAVEHHRALPAAAAAAIRSAARTPRSPRFRAVHRRGRSGR